MQNNFDYIINMIEPLIKLILQCDRKNGIVEYFKNMKTVSSAFELNLSALELTSEIPLCAYFELFNILNRKNDHIFKPLFDILKRHIPTSDTEYKLLEGIEEIDFRNRYKSENVISFFEYIKENSVGKTVILPSTLKKLNGNIPGSPVNIILNDGLESIENNSQLSGETISIPSSLITIKNCKMSNARLLEFRDYQNSKILPTTKECLVKQDIETSLGTIILMLIPPIFYKGSLRYKKLNNKIKSFSPISNVSRIPLIDIIHLSEIRFVSPDSDKPIILNTEDLKDISLLCKINKDRIYPIIESSTKNEINMVLFRLAQKKLKEILADEDSNTLQEKLETFNIYLPKCTECHRSTTKPVPTSTPKPNAARKSTFDYQLIPRATLEPLDSKNPNHIKKLKMNRNNIKKLH